MTTKPKPKPKKKVMPLPRVKLVFAEKYAHCQDLERAAAESGASPELGAEFYQDRKVRTEIKRIQNLISREQARMRARKNIVTVEKLDRELMKVAQADFKDAPQLATPKLNAVELGYRRAGVLIDDNFVPDQPTAQTTAAETPRIFRAVESKILTHQITTTTQEVTRREISAEAPMPSLPQPTQSPQIIPPGDNCQYKF